MSNLGNVKFLFVISLKMQKVTPEGGLEPPTFRLTVERANQLRHPGCANTNRMFH